MRCVASWLCPVLVAGVLAVWAASPAGASCVVNAPPVTYTPTGGVNKVISADFDGDGDVDLAVSSPITDKVVLLLNDGAGVFTAGPLVQAVNPSAMVAIDLEGDGDLDLAVGAVEVGQGVLRLFRQFSDGTFVEVASFSFPDPVFDAISADLDGDGDVDLALAIAQDSEMVVMKNNGLGDLTAFSYPACCNPRSVGVGDFDLDGDLDLAVGQKGAVDSVRLFTNDGTGTFSDDGLLETCDPGVVVGDLNGDGRADIVAANENVNCHTVTVWLASGGGDFTAASVYESLVPPRRPALVDVEGDGDLDIVLENSRFVAMLNDGTGAFELAYKSCNIGSSDSTVADLNNDGLMDFVAVDSSVFVLMGTPPSDPSPDLDCDGVVDTADLNFLLSQFGQPISWLTLIADLDCDFDVDSIDLQVLLGSFGQSP